MNMDAHLQTPIASNRTRRLGRFLETYRVPIILLIPSLIFYSVFVLMPLGRAFQLSLTDWDGLAPSLNYVGAENYTGIWTDSRFLTSLWRNVIWWAMHVVLAVGGGLFLAILISEVGHGRFFFRTIAFFPHVLSLAVVGVIWGQLYHPTIGLINTTLERTGMDSFRQIWLGNPDTALYSVGVASAWQAYGFYLVIFLAGIQSIDPQLYEAARVDGANAWQRIWDITIPSLHNTMTIVLTLAFISAMKGFGSVWAMTQGGPGYASELVAVYVWRTAFQSGAIGRAAAAGLSLALIVIVLSVIFNRWRDKVGAYS
ncbi:MAG TPA: sugar ABC transporter permease [Thermomicrobiales bacterium]|nr:sugar ABC transporter permease [Thermomicrobiales bacterium]